MGGETTPLSTMNFRKNSAYAEKLFQENRIKTEQFLSSLSSNRELLNKVKQFGFPKI